jgi:hypothetical protein
MIERKCAIKKSELWCSHNWLLHHDNIPTYSSLKTTRFVTNDNMVIIPYPPYSPDLGPCNFAFFPPKIENETEERTF